jgi:methylmalonyl-CoA mutase N-terminal domain/subunit
MGQYSGFGTAEETNERFRYLLDRGQTGFSIALDLPTQIGLDSDDPFARGEVGRVGVAIDTLDDVHRLFAGIDLSRVTQFRTSANAIGPLVTALFIAFAEEHGISPRSFRVLLQNDSLKEFPARGAWIYPPAASLKLSCDVIEYCARELPEWNGIQFCGAHYREAGGTAVQELAFAFADAIAYVEEVLSRGLPIDGFAQQFYLFVYVHTDLLEEVAKLRAARRIWAKLLRDRFGSRDEEVQKLKIFVWCGGSSLTTQQPLNNVVRVTIEALAAALGGVQTMATASYDEGMGLPTEASSKLALRTQQIVAYESGVAATADPFGGSYVIEAMTDRIEADVTRELARIDEQGGAVGAIENGYFSRALTESAFRWQAALEAEEKIVVGVNRFREDEPTRIAVFAGSPGAAERQVEHLTATRAARDQTAVDAALREVTAAAASGVNTIPSLTAAVKARATVGEACRALGAVYGEYRQTNAF